MNIGPQMCVFTCNYIGEAYIYKYIYKHIYIYIYYAIIIVMNNEDTCIHNYIRLFINIILRPIVLSLPGLTRSPTAYLIHSI